MMTLYQDDGSPFAARVRMQIYHKDLPVELEAPPGGLHTDEYRKINPLGLIPALETPEGLLSESLAIMEYLEDNHPQPPMRPANSFGRASLRRVMHYHDSKVQPPLGRLFVEMMSGRTDGESAATAATDLLKALARLEPLLPEISGHRGIALSLADCVLVPTLHFTGVLTKALELDLVTDGLPAFAAWWEGKRTQSAPARVLKEIDRAMEKRVPAANGG